MTASAVNNPFLSLIFKNLAKNANFELACPFRAGVYEIKDMVVEVPTLLSGPMLMVADSKICTEVKTFGTLRGDKNVNNFLSFGADGYFKTTNKNWCKFILLV